MIMMPIKTSIVRGGGPVVVHGGGAIKRFYRWLLRKPKLYGSMWMVASGVSIGRGVDKKSINLAFDEADEAVKELVIKSAFDEVRENDIGAIKVGKSYHIVYCDHRTGFDRSGIIVSIDLLDELLCNKAFILGGTKEWNKLVKKGIVQE